MPFKNLLIAGMLAAATTVSFAQSGAQQKAPEPESAMVDFGVLPTAPIGPPPCLQSGAFGGPADPCSFHLHHLTPEEVTIDKGGEVTFQVHGGGHGMAILEVSKDTTRDDIGQFLCPGTDPETIANPADHACNLSAVNSDASHVIEIGNGDVLVVPPGSTTHPDNRVWVVDGRLMSAGGIQFLNGGTVPAGPTSNGQLITYRFLKSGRYLVHCLNRVHYLNDWMFGFVNVR